MSNWAISVSVSHISVSPTKHDDIKGVLEITMPAKMANDRIYWKYLN